MRSLKVILNASSFSFAVIATLEFASAQTSLVGGGDHPVRISLDWQGQEPNQWSSGRCALTPDGSVVAYVSRAQLVPNDQNTLWDIYLVDRRVGLSPELISVTLTGGTSTWEAKGDPDISSDGRYVAFCSDADDLVPGDTNGGPDAFVRDRLLGTTILCSISTTGAQGHAIARLAMSDDGRFVVFSSLSTILVVPDNNGIIPDVFVRDLVAGTTERVDVNDAGVQANGASGAIDPIDSSGDGRYVVFMSEATNLVVGDTNGKQDVYLRDRIAGTTTLVSRTSAGMLGNDHSFYPRISPDGRWVSFCSRATNLVANDSNSEFDVFVRDVAGSTTRCLSLDANGATANGRSSHPMFSTCGRFVGFESSASNLEIGDLNGAWDGFIHDLVTSRTWRPAVGPGGVEADLGAAPPNMSDGARTVTFSTSSTNMLSQPVNQWVHVYARQFPVPQIYCTAKTNSLGCVSSISYAGVPMASFPSGFELRAANVLNQRLGMLLYSTHSSNGAPFQGGTLCIAQPVHRTPSQTSGGSLTGTDCSGSLAFEFNAWIAAGLDPRLAAGRQVWAQFWSRDPGFAPPDNSNLTDAVTFEIDP